MTKYYYTDSFAPDSSLVKFSYYHRGEKNLFIQFTTGSVYGYSNVTEQVWDEFVRAASAGNYYNIKVKGSYEPITDVDIVEYIGWKPFELKPETRKFVIVGHSPIQYEFEGVSVDDAMEDFKRLFPQGTLKEVRISFE